LVNENGLAMDSNGCLRPGGGGLSGSSNLADVDRSQGGMWQLFLLCQGAFYGRLTSSYFAIGTDFAIAPTLNFPDVPSITGFCAPFPSFFLDSPIGPGSIKPVCKASSLFRPRCSTSLLGVQRGFSSKARFTSGKNQSAANDVGPEEFQ
jgi:hypothetical protein